MEQEPEPSGADAVFVIVCLLIIVACFVALMCDLTTAMIREAVARFMFRG